MSKHAEAAPKEVKAALAGQGITVSEALVSKIKYSASGSVRRGRRKRQTAVNSVRTRQPGRNGITAEELIVAKGFVDKVGSLDTARQALELLSKLL